MIIVRIFFKVSGRVIRRLVYRRNKRNTWKMFHGRGKSSGKIRFRRLVCLFWIFRRLVCTRI